MGRLEALRLEAGARMGFKNVADIVIPKPVLLAAARNGADLGARYFMPHSCHKALAITGAVGIATACATPGTVAAALTGPIALPRTLAIEHPSGRLDVALETRPGVAGPIAMLLRTTRRLFEGSVIVQVPAESRSRVAHSLAK